MEKKRKSLATSMRSKCDQNQRSLWERWVKNRQSFDSAEATSGPESPLAHSNLKPKPLPVSSLAYPSAPFLLA